MFLSKFHPNFIFVIFVIFCDGKWRRKKTMDEEQQSCVVDFLGCSGRGECDQAAPGCVFVSA